MLSDARGLKRAGVKESGWCASADREEATEGRKAKARRAVCT